MNEKNKKWLKNKIKYALKCLGLGISVLGGMYLLVVIFTGKTDMFGWDIDLKNAYWILSLWLISLGSLVIGLKDVKKGKM